MMVGSDMESPRRVPAQGLVDCVQQLLLRVRLLQEVHGAVPDGLNRRRNVDAAADEHDRYVDAHFLQSLLQREPIHPRHAEVQHEAAVPSEVEVSKELECRAEDCGRESHCNDQLANRVATRIVVIDDEYSGFAHGLPLEAVLERIWR